MPRPATSKKSSGLLLRSKAHQLAEYLRDRLRARQLASPLPGMRAWSQQLGVSRRTLETTVRILQREGWLIVTARGIRPHPAPPATTAGRASTPRRVRWLLESTYHRQLYHYHVLFSLLQARLRLQDIELSWETCPPARLRAIARQPAATSELFLLASLPPALQQLFAASGKPALILGEAAPGVALPFINADLAGIVRHATFRLLRTGCTHLIMVHIASAAAGIRSAEAAFHTAIRGWTRPAVTSRILTTALDHASLQAMLRRLTAGLPGRTGILVLAPVPVGLVMTALLQSGVAVPAQVTLAALMHHDEAVQLQPPPVHYPWPMSALLRQINAAATQFFATGRLPPGGKTVTVETAR